MANLQSEKSNIISVAYVLSTSGSFVNKKST